MFTAWLIERNIGGYPGWFTSEEKSHCGYRWTTDAYNAMHFQTKEEAEKVIFSELYSHFGGEVFATDHQFD